MKRGSLRLSSCNFLRPPLCPILFSLSFSLSLSLSLVPFSSTADIENIFKREVEFSIGAREQFSHGTKRKRAFRPVSPLEKFFPECACMYTLRVGDRTFQSPVQFQARTRRDAGERNGIDKTRRRSRNTRGQQRDCRAREMLHATE